MYIAAALFTSKNAAQIASSEISARLSADGTVSFFDPPVTFKKADVDRVLAHAQEQAALLASLEREMARSKEYLTKVCVSLRCVGSELCDVLLPHISTGGRTTFYIIPYSTSIIILSCIVGQRCISRLIRLRPGCQRQGRSVLGSHGRRPGGSVGSESWLGRRRRFPLVHWMMSKFPSLGFLLQSTLSAIGVLV